MTTDTLPEVKAVSPRGLPKAWATGLFYRLDGTKKTVNTRHLLYAGILAFVGMSVVLMVFTPASQAPAQKNDIPTAVIGPQTDLHKIPAVTQATGATAYDQSQSGSTTGNKESSHVRQRGGPRRWHQPNEATPTVYSGPEVVERPRVVHIPPGVMLKAILRSGASNGPVRAELSEALSINDEQLLEEGSMLVGIGSSTEERLFIRFSQVVFHDGSVTSIQAQACDAGDQIAGLKGSEVGNYALKLVAGAGLNFLGGMSDALQDSTGQNGTVVRPPTARNALLNGSTRAALEQSNDVLSSVKNRQPIIEVPSGTRIFVLTE
jgi:hypothetical protein